MPTLVSYLTFSDSASPTDTLNEIRVDDYTQEGNKLDFLRNKNHFEKPQRGEINTAWGSAPGNPSYDHAEYNPCPLVPPFTRQRG